MHILCTFVSLIAEEVVINLVLWQDSQLLGVLVMRDTCTLATALAAMQKQNYRGLAAQL